MLDTMMNLRNQPPAHFRADYAPTASEEASARAVLSATEMQGCAVVGLSPAKYLAHKLYRGAQMASLRADIGATAALTGRYFGRA
jgi:hypothetical protein